MRIERIGGLSQLILPFTDGGAHEAGSWGLVGAATKGAALAADDNFASYIVSGTGSDLIQGVQMRVARVPQPFTGVGYSIGISAARGGIGGLVNGIQMRITNNAVFGSGTDITGIIDIVPPSALGSLPAANDPNAGAMKRFGYSFPPAQMLLLNHANFWVNFIAGAGNSDTLIVGHARMSIPV